MNISLILTLVSQLASTEPMKESIPGKLLASGSVSTSTITNNEVVYVRTNTISDAIGGQFALRLNGDIQPISFSALTPEFSTIDAVGNTTYVTNGVAKFQIVGENLQTGQRRGFIVSLLLTNSGSTLTNVALSTFASGSLSETISNGMAAKLDGLTFATTIADVYSTRIYPGTFIRNTNFWLAGTTGLTAVATCQGTSLTAISPLHAYAAWHYCPGVGATVRFVASDNTIVSRTVVARSQVLNASQYGGGDIAVLLLDSALPETVAFLKIIPGEAFTNKMPAISSATWSDNQRFKARALPAVVFNQFDRAYVREINSVGAVSFYASYPTDWYSEWGVSIITFDSGKPVTLLINNELALIGGWTFSGSGYPLGLNTAAINAAMESLSTTHSATVYTLTEYDLSTFNTY